MEGKKNLLGRKLVFFLIWPFGTFLHSLRSPQSRSSRIIIYLWFVVFGLCFMPVKEEADSYRYAQEFAFSNNMSTYTYQKEVSSFFNNSYDTEIKDIYLLTAIYLVGKVSDNVHLFFMALAMVFAFFYVKSMKYALYSEGKVRNDLIFFILFGWFCISNPIFNINGARFWTAAWMGVYIMFRYLINKDYKVLFLLPILYLVHASFILYIVVFLVFLLLGKYHKAWEVIFVISLFFSGLSFLPVLSDYVMDYFPQNLQFLVQYYTSEDYMSYRAEKMATLSAYAQFFTGLPKIAINTVAAICLLNRKSLEKNVSSSRVLEFSIVLLSLSNILSVIPSVGRYLNIVIPFLVYILLSNFDFSKQYKWVVYIIMVMYTYPIYLWILNMRIVTQLTTYIMPLPALVLKYLLV